MGRKSIPSTFSQCLRGRLLVVLPTLISFILVLVLYLNSNGTLLLLTKRSLKASARPQVSWESRSNNISNILQIKPDFADVIFLGDGIIEQWSETGKSSWNQYFASSANFGITGDRIQNLLYRIKHGNLNTCCTKIIVLSTGSDNLIGHDGALEISEGIINVLSAIRGKLPKTRIILMAPLPIGKEGSAVRLKTTETHALLKKRLPSYDLEYKELGVGKITVFNETIPSQYIQTYSDGVSLTSDGYQILSQKLSIVIDRLLKSIEREKNPKPSLVDVKSTIIGKAPESEESSQLSLPKPIEKAYVINLDIRPDRWKKLQTKFQNVGMKVDRYSAVNSDRIVWENLTFSERAKHWMFDRQTHEDFPSFGAVGCYLSHVALWQHIVDQNISSALIFEDDVVFKDTFYDDLQVLLDELVDDRLFASKCDVIDVLILGANLRRNGASTTINQRLQRSDGPIFGLYGYIVTNYAARILLQNIFPIEVQVDAYVGIEGNLLQQLGVYVVSKPLVDVARGEITNVQTEGTPIIEQCYSEWS